MTDNKIILFKHEEFGEIRTLNIDGEPWFVGKDVCIAFGDKNHIRSVARVDDVDNGWGWDFNEDTVNVGGEDVYISFLCAKDGEHLHVLDNTEDIEPTMGGLS